MNRLLEAIANVVAFFLYFITEPAKFLWRDQYSNNWWGRLFRAPAGFFVSLGFGIATAQHVGWELGYDWLSWMGAGGLAFFFSFLYAWPAACKWPLNWAFDIGSDVVEAVSKGLKKYSEPFFGGIVRALGYLPGSASTWSAVEARKDGWFNQGIQFLTGFASVAGAGYVGWNVWGITTAALASLPIVSTMLGFCAGLLVAIIIGGTLLEMLRYGKLAYVASALGVALNITFYKTILGLAAAAGLSGSLALAALPLSFVLFVAYVYPLASWALGGDFFKWLVTEKIEPLCKKAYDDNDKQYRKFFRHALNLGITAAATYGAVYLTGLVALPAWATIASIAAAAVVAYIWAYDIIDRDGDAGTALFFGSCYAGYKAYLAVVAAKLFASSWLAYTTGAVTTIIVASVFAPLAYLAVKFIVKLVHLDGVAGDALEFVHNQFEKAAKWVGERVADVYKSAYRDRSGYDRWFIQAANLVVAYKVFTGVSWVAAHFAWPVAVFWPVAALAVFVSYAAIGKFLQKSNVGIEFIGSAVALGYALEAGTLVESAIHTPWHWLSILVGFVAGSAVYGVAFPAVFIAARLVLKPVFGWSTGMLEYVHDKAWAAFDVFGSRVLAALARIVVIMKPFWARVAAAWKKVADAYARLRDRFTKKAV